MVFDYMLFLGGWASSCLSEMLALILSPVSRVRGVAGTYKEDTRTTERRSYGLRDDQRFWYGARGDIGVLEGLLLMTAIDIRAAFYHRRGVLVLLLLVRRTGPRSLGKRGINYTHTVMLSFSLNYDTHRQTISK